jgi:integrase
LVLLTDHLRLLVGVLPDGLPGKRDAALLLLGFAGAFRRSELVALTVRDIEFLDDGLKVTLRRGKTDQEGQGRGIGVPYGSNPQLCPVRSLRRWLDASGIAEGPLFRGVNWHGHLADHTLTDQVVRKVVWCREPERTCCRYDRRRLTSLVNTRRMVPSLTSTCRAHWSM